MERTNREAAGETYLDVESLIYKTIWDFRARYGGNEEDLLDVCQEAFVEAYRTHNEQLSSFVTWLRTKLWFAMATALRTEKTKHRYTHEEDDRGIRLNTIPAKKTVNFWEDIAPQFSEDARYIADCLFQAPQEAIEALLSMRSPYSRLDKVITDICGDDPWDRDRMKEAMYSLRMVS